MGKIGRIQVPPEDREQLGRLVMDRNTPQKIVWRSQIVLLAGEGIGAVEVAARVGKSVLTVRRWRRRYAAKGVDGLLKDATRPPGRKPLTGRKIKQVVNLTLNEKPPDATHWSERTMAARAGIAPSSVHKIWAAHGLKPHLTKTFKLSRDPNFVAKVEEIVGLYLNPPDKALVLAVDEKSQIQALDRTQPGLPMKKGRCGTMTHDYKRNGTTTLFAALEVLQGRVIGQCYVRHRHQEYLKFLRRLEGVFPGDVPLHLIMDNYGTHKHPRTVSWLKRHPRFISHFVPTSSSWLNLVERWFGELTSKRVRRGSFFSVDDLPSAILDFLNAWNEDPKPFVWKATVESIQAKLSRCRQTLEQIQPGCTRPRTKKRKDGLSS